MSKYTDLITSEHATKPKFMAAVDAMTFPASNLQDTLNSIAASYDLDSAEGPRLDVIGEWVGASRFVLTPLEGVYFAFDIAGVGWDQGVWARPFDPTSGKVPLSDMAYRRLIRATIAANVWDGTLPTAVALISAVFPDNQVVVEDSGGEHMTIAVGGPALDPESVALLTGGYIAIKPMGVSLRVLFTTYPPSPVFGFDADNEFIGGFDHGAWGAPKPYVPPL